MIKDGLWCAIEDVHMGITAENLAEQYNISRREQDEYAAENQRRGQEGHCPKALRRGIVPVEIPPAQGRPCYFSIPMNSPGPVSPWNPLASCGRLSEGRHVTAGNASGINDGAAALVPMTEDKAKELGIEPLATPGGHRLRRRRVPG